jgi:hypothetical protein
MQHPQHQNALSRRPIEHHMPSLPHPAQPRTHLVASPPQQRIMRKPVATIFERPQIIRFLLRSPRLPRVSSDPNQIGLGPTRIPRGGHAYFAHATAAFRRTRANTPAAATPLASPSSIAVRSATTRASCSSSSRSKVLSAARTTSLALSYRPLSIREKTNWSNSSVRFTFRVGIGRLQA